MKNRLRTVLATCATLLTLSPATAADLDRVGTLSQAQFDLLAQDLGSAFSVKGFSAGASFGLAGIDVGVGLGAASLNNRSVWQQASTGSVPSTLPLSTWRAQIGLPFNLDLAGQYVVAHSTPLRLIGTELRWGFVQEQLTVPGMSLGLSYSRLTGADEVSFDAVGLNLTVFKNLVVVTPYAGIGRVWSRTKAVNVPTLSPVSVQQNRIYAGVRLNLLLNLSVEVDRTGNSTSYGVKYGLTF